MLSLSNIFIGVETFVKKYFFKDFANLNFKFHKKLRNILIFSFHPLDVIFKSQKHILKNK
jgi:hypothetical protein